jgi:hypothetical protein
LTAASLRVVSDLTAVAAGAIVTRTIVVGFGPTISADATAELDNDGRVKSITVGVPGSGYITPPQVVISDPSKTPGDIFQGRATLMVASVAVDSGGVGYLAPVASFLGGLPPAERLGRQKDGTVSFGCVRGVNVKSPGLGYPADTQVVFQGGGESPTLVPAQGRVVLTETGRIEKIVIEDMGRGYTSTPSIQFKSPSSPLGVAVPKEPARVFAYMAQGTPARGTVTLAGDAVSGITITDPGSNYEEPPDILIRDTAGLGALAHALMGLGDVRVISKGRGYTQAATVVVTPAFKVRFPDSSDQRAPFYRLFESYIGSRANTPIFSRVPVLS